MNDYQTEQIAEIKKRLAALEGGRVTYRAATVSAVDAGASKFSADVTGAGTLSGISAEPSFLPAVGDTVRLSLVGATPIYQPKRIGEDAVGYTELAPVVGGDISSALLNSTTAMTTANGKNKVTYSTADASGTGTAAGDIWFKRSSVTGIVTGSWEWDGSAWQVRSFGDQVLNGLTAGKITAGTINADLIVSSQIATGTTGQRSGINSLGLFAYNSAGTKTVDLNGVTNLITGTMQSALTGRRIVSGSAGSTGEITFYPASGTQTSYVRSITESAGVEAIQVGLVSGQTSDSALWNRLNINSDEWTNLRSNKIDLNYLTGGAFIVRQLSSRNASATATTRIQIDASNSQFWASDNQTVYQIVNNAHIFYPATSATSGWIKIKPNLITDTNFRTPYIEWATDNNGVAGAGAYSGVMKFIMRSGGVNPAFALRDGADSVYYPIEASAFNVATSSEKVKTDIVDLTDSALPLVRKTKPRRYRLKDERFPDEQIGLVIEESPGIILGAEGQSIDLYRMVTLLWKAVQELDETKVGRP